MEMRGAGTVVRITGYDYIVYDNGATVRCTVRGRFRIGRSSEEVLPVVGDRVEYRLDASADSRGPSGLIVSVAARRSVFRRAGGGGSRPERVLGANLDHVFLVHAVRQPALNRRLIDRMIVSASRDGIDPIICVNKLDLAGPGDDPDGVIAAYARIGYTAVPCCAADGRGVERLRELMLGRLSLLAGPSGAGKTSLLAAIEPGLDSRIGEISASTGKGRHTTSHFELHALRGGGWLGDTPGIREFGVHGIEPAELGGYFREFEPLLGSCRFSGCTHSHEPSCAVKEAVEAGEIDAARYESYLRILADL